MPVTAGERFGSLDTLRGVAILGILVMNIYGFAMPFAAYVNPLRMGGLEPWNMGTWLFTHIFFDQKFVSIFAMMFGAGLVLMTERATARGARPAGAWYRRQFWLIAFGAIHGYLIWMGDILFAYALMGMLVYPLRKLRPRTLIIIACVLLPVTLLLNFGNAHQTEQMMTESAEIEALIAAGDEPTEEQQATLDEWAQQRVFMFPTDADLANEVEIYRGDYAGIVSYRAPTVAMMQFFMTLFYGLWRIAPLMMIGMALMKLEILTGKRSIEFYKRFMLTAYAIGLPLTVFSAYDLHAHDFDQLYVMRFGGIANYVGSLVVAFGHIGLVMWLVRSGKLQGLLQRFAAVGRMALTNYLSHSIILTTIFYGYGLGLFGSVPRLWQMAFVAGVIGLQLLWSPWWLARFKFGPAEWLWRSLSYWRRQPMR